MFTLIAMQQTEAPGDIFSGFLIDVVIAMFLTFFFGIKIAAALMVALLAIAALK